MMDVPIIVHPTNEASVFLPENLLERASILADKERGEIPLCCVLDFDGELVPIAIKDFGAKICSTWPCFHTKLFCIERDGVKMGIIGGTVGASFAVLIAEQLIACGCSHIIGYSSAGAIDDHLSMPCFVVPDRALRDEGTSYHYIPPTRWANAKSELAAVVARHAVVCGLPVHCGSTWTTDAPYRETRSQIQDHRDSGILSVEMEAAALMALAEVRKAEIASLLHVTNAFATTENDFHKGSVDINKKIIISCFEAFAETLNHKHFNDKGHKD